MAHDQSHPTKPWPAPPVPDLDADALMHPPWIKYPNLPRSSIGWRMGSGEFYLQRFATWWSRQLHPVHVALRAKYPEPPGWSGYWQWRFGLSMHLRFSESYIGHWASQYAYPREESELMSLRDTVQNQGFLTKEQLTLLARWKSPRSAPLIQRNSEVFVQEITAFALSAKDERSRVESLTLLDGVLWPTASVVLHLFHKDKYPILDFRALWSIGAAQLSSYTFPFWWQYVQFCRHLAKRSGVEMRILDRALWQYSKTNQRQDLDASFGTNHSAEKLLIGFEGGSVSTAERDGQFLLIINQVALLDVMDPEDQEGIEPINVLTFPSSASRNEYIIERGWSGDVA